MMIRTTLQIYNSCSKSSFREAIDLLDDKTEWVCLESLQKEIEELRLKNIQGKNYIEYDIALYHVLKLCKSPEQSGTSSTFCASSSCSPSISSSVSGEHNTGEEPRNSAEVFGLKASSPVQNPVCNKCGKPMKETQTGYFCRHHEGGGQKKCTCINSVKLKNICVRCGGAL